MENLKWAFFFIIHSYRKFILETIHVRDEEGEGNKENIPKRNVGEDIDKLEEGNREKDVVFYQSKARGNIVLNANINIKDCVGQKERDMREK